MADKKILNLIKNDKDYIWHPFTQMYDWTKDDPIEPLVIRSARGVYLYDIYGKKYIDAVSSLWVNLHGHRNKKIDAYVKNQLSRVAHSTFLGLTHEPAINLSKRLIKIVPKNLKKVFYSDNGSTAVEVALKMAYQYWQQGKRNSSKVNFVSLCNAYHGDTIGSVSVGGMNDFHSRFKSLLFKTFFAPSPYCYRCHFKGRGKMIEVRDKGKDDREQGIEDRGQGIGNREFIEHCGDMGCTGECIKEFEKILQEKHHTIAAAIIEPMIQAASGMIVMPKGYIKEFERLCRKYDILLICDEVATGFARTGKMFAVEHENIKPDFLCLAKGITGGYLPLAATITTEEVYRAFLGKYEELKTFFHGHTYTANPLACAAAIGNLEIFEKERVIYKLRNKIKHLEKELLSLKNLDNVAEIRQLGLMVGIELVKDKATKEDFALKDKVVIRICAKARSHGIILRPLGNVIVILPPLCISNKQITKIIQVIKKIIINEVSI